MITIDNVQDKIMSLIHYRLPEPLEQIRIMTTETGELSMITIISLPPHVTDSGLWECEHISIDLLETGQKMYCDNIKLKVTEYLNIAASSQPEQSYYFQILNGNYNN